MFRKITALLVFAAAVLALSSCGPKTGTGEESSRIKVSVSINALKEFTFAIGGDKVDVNVIIPDGTEPHSFEPKAQDLTALSKAQLFIISGFGLEPWAEDAVKAAGNDKLITVVASDGVAPIDITDEEEAAGHGHYDPHVWLSLKSAEIEAVNIKDALQSADPDNASFYQSNCDTFTAQLEQLYKEYSGKFTSVNKKSFITGHAAFGYLCRDFGLTQNSVEDVFAEGEPNAQQLAALVEYCRENNVTTIFSEALVSTAIADTLAREVGAKVVPIFTIASSENGKSYLERMEENLIVIYESMK